MSGLSLSPNRACAAEAAMLAEPAGLEVLRLDGKAGGDVLGHAV